MQAVLVGVAMLAVVSEMLGEDLGFTVLRQGGVFLGQAEFFGIEAILDALDALVLLLTGAIMRGLCQRVSLWFAFVVPRRLLDEVLDFCFLCDGSHLPRFDGAAHQGQCTFTDLGLSGHPGNWVENRSRGAGNDRLQLSVCFCC